MEATEKLEQAGYSVISPFQIERLRIEQPDGPLGEIARQSSGWHHATFMKIWSKVLAEPRVRDKLSAAVSLPGAETSVGARQEEGWFKARNLPMFRTQETPDGKLQLEPMKYDPVLGLVEHTVLAPEATAEQVQREARWARDNGARAMVVRPSLLEGVARELRGSETVPTAVLGFPEKKFERLALPGQSREPHDKVWEQVPTETKLADAKKAIDAAERAGAKRLELDMILDVHSLKSASALLKEGRTKEARDRYRATKRDLDTVIATAREYGAERGVSVMTKAIVETSVLNRRELRIASGMVRASGALAIKTNTGYGPRGVSVGDVRAIKRVIGNTKLIKASGGVDAAKLTRLKRNGAHLFGMSHSRDLRREIGRDHGRPRPGRGEPVPAGY